MNTVKKPHPLAFHFWFLSVELGVLFRCDYASQWEVVSVRPSVRPSVPKYFWTTNMAVSMGKKSSIDIINIGRIRVTEKIEFLPYVKVLNVNPSNGTMSDDEVVASDVPKRFLFPLFSLLHSLAEQANPEKIKAGNWNFRFLLKSPLFFSLLFRCDYASL